MKPRVLLPLLVATAVFAAGPDKPAGPSVQPAKAAVRGAADASALAPGDDTLELAPVKVTTKVQSDDRKKELERLKDQPFTWKDGGTLLKHRGHRTTTELKLQFNGEHGGLDILSLSR